jgi:hypothetical protein
MILSSITAVLTSTFVAITVGGKQYKLGDNLSGSGGEVVCCLLFMKSTIDHCVNSTL